MRTGDDDLLVAEDDEAAFRRSLASLGEPAPLTPPSDLVTRAARRLPHMPPAAAARQARRRAIIRWALGALVLAVAILGIWLQITAPAQPLLGAGDTGMSRGLLMLQLTLKPLVGVLGGLALPLLAIGAGAAAGATIVARRTEQALRSSQSGI